MNGEPTLTSDGETGDSGTGQDSIFERYDGRSESRSDGGNAPGAAAADLWKPVLAAAITALIICLLWGWLFSGGSRISDEQAAATQALEAAQTEQAAQQTALQAEIDRLSAELAAATGELAAVTGQLDDATAAAAAQSERQTAFEAQTQSRFDALPNPDQQQAALADGQRELTRSVSTQLMSSVGEQIAQTRGELIEQTDQKIGALREELSGDIGQLSQTLSQQLNETTAGVQTEVTEDLAALESSLTNQQNRLQTVVQSALSSQATSMQETRTEFETMVTDGLSQQSAAFTGQMQSLGTSLAGQLSTQLNDAFAEQRESIEADLGKRANQLQAVYGLRAALSSGGDVADQVAVLRPFINASPAADGMPATDEILVAVVEQLDGRATTLGVPSKQAVLDQFDTAVARLREATQQETTLADNDQGGLAARLTSAFSAQGTANTGAGAPANAAIAELDASLAPLRLAMASDDASAAIAAYNALDVDLRELLTPSINAALARRDGLVALDLLDGWIDRTASGAPVE